MTQTTDHELRTPVIALGASAGGLEALQQFFASLGADVPAAFVVLQHLSAAHESRMGDLLSRHTAMPVAEATDGIRVALGHVYLIPATHNLELAGGKLHFSARAAGTSINLPIDLFFESLAAHPGSPSAAIVLSGTGSDGSRGLQPVAAAGGYVLVQDPGSATFDGMPRAAIATGNVDFVGSPSELAERVRMLLSSPEGVVERPPAPAHDPYQDIMERLRQDTSVDFSHYKRGTVLRRLQRRIVRAGKRDLSEYAAHLRDNPGELRHLYQDLLISVTDFFRDPKAFAVLRDRALRPAMQAAGAEGVRIWVPGCATGEEAYSIAMLTAEIEEELGHPVAVKIFATDIDAQALSDASTGVYGADAVARLDKARLERFFDRRHGGLYSVRREIRRRILFTRHDVCGDPPFTRVDVVSCRNLLIYFGTDLQRDVLAAFHFALKSEGQLLLGPSETVGDLEDHFESIDHSVRLFQRTGRPLPSRRPMAMRFTDKPQTMATGQHAGRMGGSSLMDAAQRLAGGFAPRSLVVDEQCALRHVFGNFDDLLKLPSGIADGSLLRMVPKPLATLLAAAVPRALRSGKESVYVGLDLEGSADTNLHVVPLPERPDEARLALLVFRSIELMLPDPQAPDERIRFDAHAHAQLDELQRELQRSKESLQTLVEELETSNEELQATNEELLAANEELHSINEELHSANVLNESKIAELLQLNNDVNNLLSSTDVGTLFLDAELKVRKFTPAVGRFMHLIDSDIGRPIGDLRVPVGAAFLESARSILREGPPAEHDFTGPGGEQCILRVLPYRAAVTREPTGVIATFVDVTRLRDALSETQAVLDSLPEQIATLGPTGTIRMVNAAWRRFAEQNGCADAATTNPGADYLGVCRGPHGDDASTMAEAHAGLSDVLAGRRSMFTLEYPCHSPREQRWFLMHAAPLPAGRGAVVSHIDITARVLAERSAS